MKFFNITTLRKFDPKKFPSAVFSYSKSAFSVLDQEKLDALKYNLNLFNFLFSAVTDSIKFIDGVKPYYNKDEKLAMNEFKNFANWIKLNKGHMAAVIRWLIKNPKIMLLVSKILTEKEFNLILWNRIIDNSKLSLNFDQISFLIEFVENFRVYLFTGNKLFLNLFLHENFFRKLFKMMNFNSNIHKLLSMLNDITLKQVNNCIGPINSYLNPNFVTRDKSDTKPKFSNRIFFGFANEIIPVKNNSLMTAVLEAADKFHESTLKDLWKEYATVSIQIRVQFLDNQWRNLTQFFTVTEKNYLKWKNLLNFQVAAKAFNYESVYEKANAELMWNNVLISYKKLTDEDQAIMAAGSIDKAFSDLTPDSKDSLHKAKWFSIWPLLIPHKWKFEDIDQTNIVSSRYKDKVRYIENLSIINPVKTPTDIIAKLDPQQLADMGKELLQLANVNKDINNDSQKFIKVSIKILDLDNDTRFCEVFHNELAIATFHDKVVQRITVNDEKLVYEFNRTFENGEVINIKDENIIWRSGKNDIQVFMKNKKTTTLDAVENTQFLTYDLETRSVPVLDLNGEIKLDSSGKPIKKLEMISAAIYKEDMKKIDPNIYSWYKPLIACDMNQDSLANHFLSNIKHQAMRLAKLGEVRTLYAAAHNASRFDEVFLLKYLVRFIGPNDELNFIKKDDKFIIIDWVLNGKFTAEEIKEKHIPIVHVKFIDSYLMLPSSLAKLAKTFGVEEKGQFNVKDINQNTDLFSINKELEEYNIQDCRILWRILSIFAATTVNEFEVNVFASPTASSLAFSIYRTKFLKPNEHKVNITDLQTYNQLKPAYQGGACDVYTPTNPPGSKINYYDVNSMYPAMMAQNPMPTGPAIRIKGKVAWEDPTFCGFVTAEINCPENIKVPLLPRVVNGKTIAGAGTWTGTYFAAELREALKLGYQIKCIEAIQFEGRVIFEEFINTIYQKRLGYDKSNPMNMICKLIMNSTYGRFGMSPYLSEVELHDIEGTHSFNKGSKVTLINGELVNTSPILEIKQFSPTKVMVVRQKTENEFLVEESNKNLQISIPIAAATTSYSRINLHRIKMQAAELGVLLYSDTDSVVTSGELPSEMLGKSLGQLKLEYTADKGVFLAPKVYALKNAYEGDNFKGDIIKAKGLKNLEGLTFETFERLLNMGESHNSYQEKWFRNLEEGTIEIKNLKNEMKVTSGKRLLIINTQNQFIDTGNVIFKDGEIISPKTIKLGLPEIYKPLEIMCLVTPEPESLDIISQPTPIPKVIHLPQPLPSVIHLKGSINYKWLKSNKAKTPRYHITSYEEE